MEAHQLKSGIVPSGAFMFSMASFSDLGLIVVQVPCSEQTSSSLAEHPVVVTPYSRQSGSNAPHPQSHSSCAQYFLGLQVHVAGASCKTSACQ
jgi:hypothetical protein